MDSFIQNYANQNFIAFTLEGIVLNENNKKQLLGMPNWKNIKEHNYQNYCFNNHRALAVITGKMSGITCIDFDVKDGKCSYETVIETYPELKQYKTVKTQSGGYHIYCKYDETIKTTTNAFECYENVDIRNDDAILFAPPTKVYKNRQVIGEYTDLGGDILEIPTEFKQQLKQFKLNNKVVKPSITKPVSQPATPVSTTSQAETPELSNIKLLVIEILKFEPTFFDDYDKWSQLGYIIYNENDGEQAGLELFIELSKLFHSDSGRKHQDKELRKQYYKTQPSREKKIYVETLYSWLEKLNPTHELLKGRKKTKFASNDDEASDILYEEMKHVFKSYKGRLFYLHDNIWTHDEMVIDDIVLNYVMKSNIYAGINEKTNKTIPYTQNVTKAKKVQEALYSKIRVYNNDANLYSKFHTTTKNKLCFEDGVLDFNAKTFTLWADVEPNSIYPTIKINRPYRAYFESPNFEVISEIKEKIFDTLYGDKTNKALQFLSRALAGHHEDKRWATYLGNRNCGKGVEYDLLSEGLESYVSTFELGNMLYCRKTAGTENVDCSKKLYWLMDLEFVRLAVSQEVPDCNSGLQVNSKILKKITGGGDEIVARRNYDRKDTHFKIDTSFYIKGNNTLVCDNVDCDETRVEFCSVVQFKTTEEIEMMKQEGRDEKEMVRYKIADKDIKNKCKSLEWKNAIVYLILMNYSDKCVEIEKSVDIEDNTLLGSIHERYELTYNKEDVILCSELHAEMASFDKGKIALELNAMNIFKKRETKGTNKGKFVYIGLKQKQEETDL